MNPETQTEEYWINRPADDPERDWKIETDNWLDGYVASKDHPHRDLILNALETIDCPVDSLLEIGCNTGPNLVRIHDKYPTMKLEGIDVSQDAINQARIELPDLQMSQLRVGKVQELPYADQSFDVVLCDAVLMYVQPNEIHAVINKLTSIARYGIIIVDRFAQKDEKVGHGWGRDYNSLLGIKGFTINITKITEKQWPDSLGWKNHGYFFQALRSQTFTPNSKKGLVYHGGRPKGSTNGASL